MNNRSIDIMKVEVVREDITQLDVEAIVNPANSGLVMGGGLAGIIKDKGGTEIEEEAQEHAPVDVGEAVITMGGDLPAKHVIHAPTMESPAKNVPTGNVGRAMRGILECAEGNGVKEVAVPGLGTGVGGVSAGDAAEAMLQEIKDFKSDKIEKIILVGYGEELFGAFKEAKEHILP